jgi:hypothetical protein
MIKIERLDLITNAIIIMKATEFIQSTNLYYYPPYENSYPQNDSSISPKFIEWSSETKKNWAFW